MRIDRFKLTTELMKRGLTAKALAEQAQLTRATVCNVRTGKSCSYETGVKIANALGMDLNDLLEVNR